LISILQSFPRAKCGIWSWNWGWELELNAATTSIQRQH
jgi:hypothetical protein